MEVTKVHIPLFKIIGTHFILLECFEVNGAAIHASPNYISLNISLNGSTSYYFFF
jgi:hypothetical protein